MPAGKNSITATMLVGNNCTDVLFCRKCELRKTVLRRANTYLSSHARFQKKRNRESLENDYQERRDRYGDERGKNFRGVTGPNIYRQLKLDTGVAMAQCLSHDLFEGAIKVRKINFFFQGINTCLLLAITVSAPNLTV